MWKIHVARHVAGVILGGWPYEMSIDMKILHTWVDYSRGFFFQKEAHYSLLVGLISADSVVFYLPGPPPSPNRFFSSLA